MRVTILHNEVGHDAPKDDLDTIRAVEETALAVQALGWEVTTETFSPSLETLREKLARSKPSVVFNLVEAVEDQVPLCYLAATLLEQLNIPFTGSSSDALFLSADKTVTKELLRFRGIRTADWLDSNCQHFHGEFTAGRYIVKPLKEECSRGIEYSSVVDVATVSELAACTKARSAKLKLPCFAEKFVGGREFHVSILEIDGVVRVLPLGEILYDSFPPETPEILDYDAKWERESVAYIGTRRETLGVQVDDQLSASIHEATLGSWHALRVGSYARTDIRIEGTSDACVLEVNTNPASAPELPLAEAASVFGINYPDLIRIIVMNAFRRM